MSSRIDTSPQTIRSAGTTPPNTPSHQPFPGGLANVGTSLQVQESASGGGWVHWIKEKVTRLFQSVLSCFSCFFCRVAANSAPIPMSNNPAMPPAETSPLNQSQTGTTPVSPQTTQPNVPTVAPQVIAQRIPRAIEALGSQMESLSHHIRFDVTERWTLEGRVVFVMKYNGRTALELGLVSEGIGALTSRATERLLQLLNSPVNQLCGNDEFAISTCVFSRRNLRLPGVDCHEASSTVSLNNNAVNNREVNMRQNVEERALFDILAIANPENAANLLEQLQAHVAPLINASLTETAQADLDRRISMGIEAIDYNLNNSALDYQDPKHLSIFIALKYNEDTEMTLHRIIEGRDNIRNEAVRRVQQLLNYNRFCENGSLSIHLLTSKMDQNGEFDCVQRGGAVRLSSGVGCEWNPQTDHLSVTTLPRFLETVIPDPAFREMQLRICTLNSIGFVDREAATAAEVQALLNQTIERGKLMIAQHFNFGVYNYSNPLSKNIVVMKYNGEVVISLRDLSQGIDALRVEAIEKLEELLNHHRYYRDGSLTIESHLFTRDSSNNFSHHTIQSSFPFTETGSCTTASESENSLNGQAVVDTLRRSIGGYSFFIQATNFVLS